MCVVGPGDDEVAFILAPSAGAVFGLQARTGKPLWHLGPNSEVPVGSPVSGDGLIFVTAGYPPVRPIYAIRPGSRGAIDLPQDRSSSSEIAWPGPPPTL